jgi:Uma2 family endonuclease
MAISTDIFPPLSPNEENHSLDPENWVTEPPLEALSPSDWPQIDHLITEDDTPVDNIPSAKQQRLLVESLYNAWKGTPEAPAFIADANIGIFFAVGRPPLVPDVFLSLDVQVAQDWWNKRHRSYFIWEFGKPPDVVIEIVSNNRGGEDTTKMRDYARIKIAHYVIFDPQALLNTEPLRIYELVRNQYVKQTDNRLAEMGLSLTLWTGQYEGKEAVWLRWCDAEGRLIWTGAERAEQEYQRAERLAAKLRELGMNPDTI